MSILVGTDDGLYTLGEDERSDLRGHKVGALVADGDAIWALADGVTIYGRGTTGIWRMRTRIVGKRSKLPRYDQAPAGTCLHPLPDGGFLVGTTGAHLLRVTENDGDAIDRVESFESVSGRDGWEPPTGGSPDVRSISADRQDSVYVNVAGGGIPKSSDNGTSWIPTIDTACDVQQVLAVSDTSNRVHAATAKGVASSADGGMTWEFRVEGLAGSQCWALAANSDHLFVSASADSAGEHAAIYRAQLAEGAFEQCTEGLPAALEAMVGPHCLTANGSTVAFGTSDGRVYVSDDSGLTWRAEGSDLPAVRCLLVS